MSDFWIPDKAYTFWRRYVDWCTRHSFFSLETVGELPPMDQGAWFIVSNHTHTLIDALVLLQGRREATAFGARADVFRNPTAARLLHFCKIVPLARKDRDKPEEVAHNRHAMEYIDQIVAHGVPFCLFPEGRHRPKHSLLPLRRGVASMAFRSAAQRPTYILPVGLDYSDWFHFRGRARIRYGEPIDVNAFASAVSDGIEDSRRDALLLEELSKRLSSLILFIPDDGRYEETLAQCKDLQPSHRLRDRILSVLLFPLFVVSAVLALPMWVSAESLCARMKDHAWNNTVRYAVKLVSTPLWGLILGLLLFVFFPPWIALALLFLFLPSYSFFYDWLNLAAGRTSPI